MSRKTVRKAVVLAGLLFLFGGVGYSEMPGGHFWIGIGEAFLGLGILLIIEITP